MGEHDSLESLVGQARLKDKRAADALFERFRPLLENQVRARMGAHVRSRLEVDDVVQETFLKAYEHLDGLEWRGEEAFGRWLGCVAEHPIWKTHQGCSRSPIRLDHDVAQQGTSVARSFTREERFARLEEALGDLAPDYREVILLARIERLSAAEIAERMSRSPNAVKKLLARALIELKRRFGDTTGSLRLPDRSLESGGGRHDN